MVWLSGYLCGSEFCPTAGLAIVCFHIQSLTLDKVTLGVMWVEKIRVGCKGFRTCHCMLDYFVAALDGAGEQFS